MAVCSLQQPLIYLVLGLFASLQRARGKTLELRRGSPNKTNFQSLLARVIGFMVHVTSATCPRKTETTSRGVQRGIFGPINCINL